jgi:hypothetical protein
MLEKRSINYSALGIPRLAPAYPALHWIKAAKVYEGGDVSYIGIRYPFLLLLITSIPLSEKFV